MFALHPQASYIAEFMADVTAPSWHKPAIVLVENDENDAFFVREALKKANIGNPLITFASADAARQHVSAGTSKPPALFILDINLDGGETGLDFLRWLRAQPAPFGTTPAIVMTGSQDPHDRSSSVGLEALCFLPKPVTAAELGEAVQSLGFVVRTNALTGALGFWILERY